MPTAITALDATTISTLSSIGPNSYLSTNDATAPDIAPHIGIEGSALLPMKYPSGMHKIAIPRLPHALFVRLANNLNSSSSKSIFLTRQIDCFQKIISNMPSEDLGLANLDIYAECLRRAHENMGYLLGEQEKDRVLGEIFSNFCIGK